MKIRKATGSEMLELWGYRDTETASPTARFFHENIRSGNAVFWALDDGGQLIGELYVFSGLEDTELADGMTTAYLCAFRVREDRRGRGLGTELMETVLADLKNRGFRRATIGADEERNVRLYRRLGFTKEIKVCYEDPCARDAAMQPVPEEAGWLLLARDL